MRALLRLCEVVQRVTSELSVRAAVLPGDARCRNGRHVSKATRAELDSKFPWIRTAYVLPVMTSVAQPADVAFLVPLKECLWRITSLESSRLILDTIDAGASQ